MCEGAGAREQRMKKGGNNTQKTGYRVNKKRKKKQWKVIKNRFYF